MNRIEYWRNVLAEAEVYEAKQLKRAARLMIRIYEKWGNENVTPH